MATGILVSEEEYLHSSYEPDCEFEDGVLIERNLGAWEHGELQVLIAAYFSRYREDWGIRVQLRLASRFATGNI